MTWFDEVAKTVDAQGQRPCVLHAGDGRLLVAERGARVLACELPGVDHNLFFHTDQTGDAKITGGDRLWIAPEVAYFWPSLDDALRDPKGTAATPSAVDPAEWHAPADAASDTALRLTAAMELHDRRNQSRGTNTVQRSFRALTALRPDGLAWCAFSVQHVLETTGSDDPGRTMVAGAWSILQVPPTGTLICPVTRKLEPDTDIRSYYDPFGNRHVVCDNDAVRFLIDGQHRTKMGIRAEHTTGRMGYYRPLGDDNASLILRVFAPLPGEPYCDLPRDDPRHRQLAGGEIDEPVLDGDCLQAYNDDGDAFGGGPGVTFGEMEYHDPCLILGRGPTSRTGRSVTHVVAGPDERVRAFGRELLGVAVEPLV